MKKRDHKQLRRRTQSGRENIRKSKRNNPRIRANSFQAKKNSYHLVKITNLMFRPHAMQIINMSQTTLPLEQF